MAVTEPVEALPVPFWINEPVTLIAIAGELVKVPLFVIVNEPPFVAVSVPTPAFKVKFVPIKLIPAGAFVLSRPENVVVPVPACCAIELAVTAWNCTLFALVTVRAASRVTPPQLLRTLMLPLPATRPTFCPPFRVLDAEKEIVPPPAWESNVTGAISVTGLVPEKLMPALPAEVLVVVIELLSSTLPEPF